MRRTYLILGILHGLWLTDVAEAGLVTGRVNVIGRAAQTSVTTVVYAESLDSRQSPQPGRYSLLQRNKTFIPHVLAIPAGSTVNFPNNDLIFHNVFSLSRPKPFDLGLYRSGSSKSQLFSAAATYRVFCNIHPQMTAIILVLPTSFITEVDTSGAYRLDLPTGRWRVTAWSERSQPVTTEIRVASTGATSLELTLDESQFVELRHRNKFGQDYPKSAYDPLTDKRSSH
jgi:plastocyanin